MLLISLALELALVVIHKPLNSLAELQKTTVAVDKLGLKLKVRALDWRGCTLAKVKILRDIASRELYNAR
jgi:hypothetical protein